MTRASWVVGPVVIVVVAALVVAAGRVAWAPVVLAAACLALLLRDAVRAVAGSPAIDASGRLTAAAAAPAIEREPAPAIEREPASAIERELERCRRHRRSCTVARVAGAQEHLRGLSARVRRTDRVWAVGHDLVLLLPETDRVGASRAMTRLLEGVRLEAPVAVACFPQDALTAHALIDALRAPARPSSPRGVASVRAPRLAPIETAAQLDASPRS